MSAVINQGNALRILSYIKHFVTKRVYTGISFILHPCCGIEVDSVDFECVSTGHADITFTLNKAINFPGTVQVTVNSTISGVTTVISNTEYTSGTTSFTIPNIAITAGAVSYSLVFLLITSTEVAEGVFLASPAKTATKPNCP